jgi:hypothetical protein
MRLTSLCDFILFKAVERLSYEMSCFLTPRRGFLVRFLVVYLHSCLVRFPYEISNASCSIIFPMRFQTCPTSDLSDLSDLSVLSDLLDLSDLSDLSDLRPTCPTSPTCAPLRHVRPTRHLRLLRPVRPL